MRYYSIRFKITVLFVVVFVLSCALFVISINLALDSSNVEQNEYNGYIVEKLISNHSPKSNIDVVKYLSDRGFKVVKDKTMIEKIEDGQYFFKIATDFGIFSSIAYRYTVFLRVQNQDYDLFLTTKKGNMTLEFVVFGFLASLLIVLLLYLSIMRSLTPLERLRRQITQTLNGEDFYTGEYQNDEIGEIANEFLSTIGKMRELVESRQLFLRTIMHEFKTPIGKGRIVAEMIKEDKQKKRLISIFKRLNSLIDESAKIESLFSKNYKLRIRSYSFNEILHQSKKLLFRDDFDKMVKIKKNTNPTFSVDIDIFTLVLRNLIDNAIKYSQDNSCVIECFENCIFVKNKGEPLEQDYTEYLKPFTRGKDNKIDGMGLGLYIVQKTCESHNFKLSYKYVDSYHCFKITTPPPRNYKNKIYFLRTDNDKEK